MGPERPTVSRGTNDAFGSDAEIQRETLPKRIEGLDGGYPITEGIVDDDHFGTASGQHAADPTLAVDGHDHPLVERLDRQCRQVLRARSARVAQLAFLKSAVYRRLAAADLVIARIPGRLVLGHWAAAILLARATRPPSCHGEVPHRISGVFAIVQLITTSEDLRGSLPDLRFCQ